MSIAAAVFLYNTDASQDLLTALSQLPHVKRIPADAEVCKAFHAVRLPLLILYNADSEETARACGDLHVQELIKQTAAEI